MRACVRVCVVYCLMLPVWRNKCCRSAWSPGSGCDWRPHLPSPFIIIAIVQVTLRPVPRGSGSPVPRAGGPSVWRVHLVARQWLRLASRRRLGLATRLFVAVLLVDYVAGYATVSRDVSPTGHPPAASVRRPPCTTLACAQRRTCSTSLVCYRRRWLGSRVVSVYWTQAQKGPGSNRSRDAVG